MLVGEGPLLRKNVRTTSTSTSRPTTCPRSKRTSTATIRSARRRRGRTWGGRRKVGCVPAEQAGAVRHAWQRVAMVRRPLGPKGARTGCTGAAAGATAARAAGRRTAADAPANRFGLLGFRLARVPVRSSRASKAERTPAEPERAESERMWRSWRRTPCGDCRDSARPPCPACSLRTRHRCKTTPEARP